MDVRLAQHDSLAPSSSLLWTQPDQDLEDFFASEDSFIDERGTPQESHGIGETAFVAQCICGEDCCTFRPCVLDQSDIEDVDRTPRQSLWDRLQLSARQSLWDRLQLSEASIQCQLNGMENGMGAYFRSDGSSIGNDCIHELGIAFDLISEEATSTCGYGAHVGTAKLKCSLAPDTSESPIFVRSPSCNSERLPASCKSPMLTSAHNISHTYGELDAAMNCTVGSSTDPYAVVDDTGQMPSLCEQHVSNEEKSHAAADMDGATQLRTSSRPFVASMPTPVSVCQSIEAQPTPITSEALVQEIHEGETPSPHRLYFDMCLNTWKSAASDELTCHVSLGKEAHISDKRCKYMSEISMPQSMMLDHDDEIAGELDGQGVRLQVGQNAEGCLLNSYDEYDSKDEVAQQLATAMLGEGSIPRPNPQATCMWLATPAIPVTPQLSKCKPPIRATSGQQMPSTAPTEKVHDSSKRRCFDAVCEKTAGPCRQEPKISRGVELVTPIGTTLNQVATPFSASRLVDGLTESKTRNSQGCRRHSPASVKRSERTCSLQLIKQTRTSSAHHRFVPEASMNHTVLSGDICESTDAFNEMDMTPGPVPTLGEHPPSLTDGHYSTCAIASAPKAPESRKNEVTCIRLQAESLWPLDAGVPMSAERSKNGGSDPLSTVQQESAAGLSAQTGLPCDPCVVVEDEEQRRDQSGSNAETGRTSTIIEFATRARATSRNSAEALYRSMFADEFVQDRPLHVTSTARAQQTDEDKSLDSHSLRNEHVGCRIKSACEPLDEPTCSSKSDRPHPFANGNYGSMSEVSVVCGVSSGYDCEPVPALHGTPRTQRIAQQPPTATTSQLASKPSINSLVEHAAGPHKHQVEPMSSLDDNHQRRAELSKRKRPVYVANGQHHSCDSIDELMRKLKKCRQDFMMMQDAVNLDLLGGVGKHHREAWSSYDDLGSCVEKMSSLTSVTNKLTSSSEHKRQHVSCPELSGSASASTTASRSSIVSATRPWLATSSRAELIRRRLAVASHQLFPFDNQAPTVENCKSLVHRLGMRNALFAASVLHRAAINPGGA